MAEMADGDERRRPRPRSRGTGPSGRARRWRRRTGSTARGFYAFATAKPREKPPEAEPGPNRARRQARMEALAGGGLVDEDTVLPAVPAVVAHARRRARAQSEIDHLGGAALATDWGTRLLSDQSELYDPLSYHYGSVWPLFTGWTSMAAYRYGRPARRLPGADGERAAHVLRARSAPSPSCSRATTHAPFGRSSHHQIWSQAMVVTPLLRGLFGLEVEDAGRDARLRPAAAARTGTRRQLGNVAAGARAATRARRGRRGGSTIALDAHGGEGALRLSSRPRFPLDARVRSVTRGRAGARFEVDPSSATCSGPRRTSRATGARLLRRVRVRRGHRGLRAGAETPEPGARSEGLRLLRAQAEGGMLRLSLRGARAAAATALRVRSPRAPAAPRPG